MKNPEEFLGEYSQTGPFGLLEIGQITPAQFHEALRPYLPENVTDSQIDSAFCEFLKGIPEHRLEELKALKKKYKVYILFSKEFLGIFHTQSLVGVNASETVYIHDDATQIKKKIFNHSYRSICCKISKMFANSLGMLNFVTESSQ